MSGFLAVIDPSRRLLAEAGLVRPMAMLSSRGDRYAVWRNSESVMAVARFDWELADEFSGSALIVHDEYFSLIGNRNHRLATRGLCGRHGPGSFSITRVIL